MPSLSEITISKKIEENIGKKPSVVIKTEQNHIYPSKQKSIVTTETFPSVEEGVKCKQNEIKDLRNKTDVQMFFVGMMFSVGLTAAIDGMENGNFGEAAAGYALVVGSIMLYQSGVSNSRKEINLYKKQMEILKEPQKTKK